MFFSLCTSACVWAWVSVSLLTWHTSAHLFMHICISLCVWVCQKEQKPGRKPRFSPSRIPNSHSFPATPSLAFSLSTPSAFLFHSSYCLDLRNQRKPKGAKNYYALSFDLTFCATKAFNMQMTKWASWGHGHWLCSGRGGFWLLGSEVWSIGTFAHFINAEPNGGVPFPIPLAAN